MENKDFTFQEKLKYVQTFKNIIVLKDVADDLTVDKSLITHVINGDKTDHHKIIDTCYNRIQETLKKAMPIG